MGLEVIFLPYTKYGAAIPVLRSEPPFKWNAQ